MGRSVNYIDYAQAKTFFTLLGDDENDDYLRAENYRDFITELISALCEMFPSLIDVSHRRKFQGNEVHIILENNLCQIAISEYCSLYSLSIAVNYNVTDYANTEGLAINWCRRIWAGVEKYLNESSPFVENALCKVGTFSNGEGVYTKL